MLPYNRADIGRMDNRRREDIFDPARMGDGDDDWRGFPVYGFGPSLGNGDWGNGDTAWRVESARESTRDASRGRLTPANIRPQSATYCDPRPSSFSPPNHQLSSTSAHYSSLDNPTSNLNSRSTLWWGDLEPWMDEEYAKQVCALMGWDNNGGAGDGGVTVKIPHPPPDPTSGNQANNPGYCFLTFPNSQQAANVLAKLHHSPEKIPMMPNSTRPFNLNWASVPAPASVAPVSPPHTANNGPAKPSGPVREHSIFVGDLAPEASNSDLLAVFRNPILGLRSDRAPKCVRPFYTCKSAKIMLDPVTGVSKGYGFVRFTDQGEQQRALMEMHGLYCLSRPMRVSPATAKFKPASPPSQAPIPASNSFTPSLPSLASSDSQPSFNTSMDSNVTPGNKSVSTPLAHELGTPIKGATPALPTKADFTLLQQLSNGQAPNSAGLSPEELWNSPANAQARAILASLTGPNGEQLSSADPYNTTVFVGGLSPLISEDTLRTFFAPFGDIHYVKVPVGKHCGFVQFVRKADAQRAIDRMQGFPIGGSRIRLSWGRSQYKAAQAVVQQAQLQAQHQAQAQAQHPPPPHVPTHVENPVTAQLTPEQAVHLLQKFGYNALMGNAQSNGGSDDSSTTLVSPSVHNVPLGFGTQKGDAHNYINHAPPQYTNIPTPENIYGRASFSPFELAQLNGEHAAARFNQAAILRAPGPFGPSHSLPANLKLNPASASNGTASPPSSGSQTAFNVDASPYNQFFDSSARGAYLNVSDMLRMDTQTLPRSNSNKSDLNGLDGSSPSHSTSYATALDGLDNGAKGAEIADLNGTLASLNLDVLPPSHKPTSDIAERSADALKKSLAQRTPSVQSPVGSVGA